MMRGGIRASSTRGLWSIAISHVSGVPALRVVTLLSADFRRGCLSNECTLTTLTSGFAAGDLRRLQLRLDRPHQQFAQFLPP